MQEEQTGVLATDEVDTSSLPEDNNEQAQEQVESDISTADGKDYKTIAEQLSRDIKEKNRKIQELKSQQNQPVQPRQVTSPNNSDDETLKRFLQVEANATIALKMQTDPSFRDRADIVQHYVEQGYDINMADRLAKADIMDKVLASGVTEKQPVINTIQPSAIPEVVHKKETGNSLNDIQNGSIPIDENSDAIKEMLKKYRPQW